MNVLVVYTHPNPKSFNHAIKETVVETLNAQGHEVRVKDLYTSGFDPILDGEDFAQIMSGTTPPDIKAEQEDVLWADGLVFIYPLWWFDRPALLKGWFDRVFLQGFAFGVEGMEVRGLLKHKFATVFQTTGGPEESFAAADAIGVIERSMAEGTLGFSGIKNVEIKTFYGVPIVDDATRKGMLEEVKAIIAKY